uniref:Uncharacterized protein n=1 Tax=Catharus ustulatus TaxID=91951 RepID=A0A8C3VI47_CATUS
MQLSQSCQLVTELRDHGVYWLNPAQGGRQGATATPLAAATRKRQRGVPGQCHQEEGEGHVRPLPPGSGRRACPATAVGKRRCGVPGYCCCRASQGQAGSGSAQGCCGLGLPGWEISKIVHVLTAPECKPHFRFGSKILVKMVRLIIVKLLYYSKHFNTLFLSFPIKVRSMWALIVEMLTSLKEEKEIVDSVLEDCVNPCILDGTDVVLRLPGLLNWSVESYKYGFCTGNLYEDGKLNFLTVIQLLNEALMTLRDEHCPCELKTLDRIENLVASYRKILQEFKTRREQEIWESKWKTILGCSPYNLIFKDILVSSVVVFLPQNLLFSNFLQIARTVCESTYSDEEKGIAFDDLISSLSFNPFLTRKQIPRTPENLLTEIRSSWRKAIQTEASLDLQLSSTEVVSEESSMDAAPSVLEEVDSNFVCSERASPLSDLGPPVSENKSQLSSTEFSSQEQVNISHTFESSDSKTSGIQESERSDSEELGSSALSGSSSEDVSQTSQNLEKSMNIPDACLKSDSRTNTLPSDHCRSFLMLGQNVSTLNSVSHETGDMGILNETLPECDTDLSISACSDSFFSMDSEKSMDDSENYENVEKLDLDIQSQSNSHEVLKKTPSKRDELLHQTHNRDEYEYCGAELYMIPEEEEEDDDGPSINEGFTKMPLPNSPNESRYSLSSLLVSCQQMDGT